MYQNIPGKEFYDALEKNLIRQGLSAYLTPEELIQSQDSFRYKEGYETYTGYKMSQVEADSLNTYTDELNRTRTHKVRQYLMDARHQMFCAIAEELTPEDMALRSSAAARNAQKAA